MKKIFSEKYPSGDLPFFLILTVAAVSMLLAIKYKSLMLFKIAFFLFGVDFVYAAIWMAIYNFLLSRRLK